MSFWGELKRRNVFKVGVAYAIVAWLLVQIANTFFPILHLPDWAVTLVAVLVILGFPLALLFAWAFELTPEGLKKTEHVPLEESITHLTGQKLNYILVCVIVLGVAYLLFDNLYLDKLAIQTEVESRIAELAPPTDDEEEAPKTIAVLPFADLSPAKDQEYFVDGLSEELLNCLAKIPDLSVTSRTSAFSFKDKDKTVQEIASVLGVGHILEGSVRKSGDKLRITVQLIRASDDRHLWSETYDRELKDIFSVQEDIATTVGDELKVKLGVGESFIQLGRTDNEKAYELYLIANGQYKDMEPERALTSINEAIALDSDFALAWALKSQIICGTATFAPDDELASIIDKSTNAAHKAIELEPKLAAGYFALGQIKVGAYEWIESQLAFNKVIEFVADPSQRFESEFPMFYQAVGYLERAKIIWEGQLQNDPLNFNFRSNYCNWLSTLGDYKKAEEEYQRFSILFPDMSDTGDAMITYARLVTHNAVSSGELPYSSPIYDSVKGFLKSPKEGLIELNRIYRDDNNLTSWDILDIALWAAYFGDPEFAMDLIEKAAVHRIDALYALWSPVYHDVRQLPRFKEFVREIGLVDYWEQFGWPDLCHPTDNGDFECE